MFLNSGDRMRTDVLMRYSCKPMTVEEYFHRYEAAAIRKIKGSVEEKLATL